MTGRFPERPHYDSSELDHECELLISSFLRIRYSQVQYPIKTEDLTVLLEENTSDLDTGTDLSDEGDDVEGMTVFYQNRKPEVRIDIRFAEETWRENRLRTTLAHELGHVKLHRFLWVNRAKQASFFDEGNLAPARCLRETILGAKQVDWMEWQAGYASGAILMPFSVLRQTVRGLGVRAATPPIVGEPDAERIIAAVQAKFSVSRDAARVRLSQQGMVTGSRRVETSSLLIE